MSLLGAVTIKVREHLFEAIDGRSPLRRCWLADSVHFRTFQFPELHFRAARSGASALEQNIRSSRGLPGTLCGSYRALPLREPDVHRPMYLP